ncbi:MAG: alpha/beta hydrolase [Phycisphaerales bacterium]|nr:alpha/beta hydrolase [Phycisphaerales bacterium]
MLRIAHQLIMQWYFVGPVIALALAIGRSIYLRRPIPVLSWLMTAISAAVIGGFLSFIYAQLIGGRVMISQMALVAYFGAGMLYLLKGLDYLLRWLARRLFGLTRQPPRLSDNSDGSPVQPPPSPALIRRTGAFVLRIVLLTTIGLPYVMAAVMTYRLRVDPVNALARPFEQITFVASDQTQLSGWWIPADPAPPDAPADWGQRTLLLCHGLGANKSTQLSLGQWGLAAGYNLLSFDFRAHGQSQGQLATFGELERLDVLAAVGWLQQNRPGQSRKIFGVGASMGAAALLAAAADPSPQGQAIDAVVLYASYADFNSLAKTVADRQFIWPLNLLVRYLAVPMAEAQTGQRLTQFSPQRLIADIWPRPVMIIHGMNDEIIPYEQGEQLAEHAAQPFLFLPVPRKDHNQVIDDPATTRMVHYFLETARPVPAI